MEGIDLVQNLQNERKRLFESVDGQKKALADKLLTLFNTIKDDNLELLPLYIDLSRPWRPKDEDQSSFEVTTTIRYKNIKGETWKDGTPRDEFGCDISLYIYEFGIEMNYGTTGTYSRNDLGQVARAKLVCKLWENEDTIVSIAKATLNMVDYGELQEVNRQLDQIDRDIKTAERKAKEDEIVRKLKKGTFLAKRKKRAINERWDSEQGEWVNDGYEYIYHSFENIKKITDTNVLTQDTQWLDNHRRNLQQVIYSIMAGELFILTEKIEKEPIPEETSTN